jgi:hypothetical protein
VIDRCFGERVSDTAQVDPPEHLNYRSPVHHMRCTAMRDAMIGGQAIEQGDKIVMWYMST